MKRALLLTIGVGALVYTIVALVELIGVLFSDEAVGARRCADVGASRGEGQ